VIGGGVCARGGAAAHPKRATVRLVVRIRRLPGPMPSLFGRSLYERRAVRCPIWAGAGTMGLLCGPDAVPPLPQRIRFEE